MRLLGRKQPKVAVLAAVETVNPMMPATLDAAALTVMAARGQCYSAVAGLNRYPRQNQTGVEYVPRFVS